MTATFRLFLLAILGVGTMALGADSVWIRSLRCGSSDAITTSGVPVKFLGKTYVLTSSWGLLEEQTGNCHEVGDPTDGKMYPAELAALDWAVGYALLEVPGLPAVLDLNQFTSEAPSAPDLTVPGFNGGPETKHGRIVSSKSTRHHFVGLPFAFEMLADRMPNTFVGAPVYGKTLDGIVSGQWLELLAGTYSRIREWKTKGIETPNHFFVIPIALIRQSLQNGFPKRTTFQSSAAKLGDRSTLLVGKHEWRIVCPPGAGEPPLDGIGPIGGGDGVGVGGSMKGTETCTTRVTAQKQLVLQSPPFYPAAFSKELDQTLTPGKALVIPFLSTRNVGGRLTRVPFFSLPHFFNALAKDKRYWVLAPETPPVLTGSTDMDRYLLENRRLKQLLLDTYSLISSREDDRDDYRYLYTHVIIIDSLNRSLVRWTDLGGMITKTAPQDFAVGLDWQGQPLRQVVKSILDRLEKLYLATGGSR